MSRDVCTTVSLQTINGSIKSCIENWKPENQQDQLNIIWQILESSADGVVQDCVCNAIKTLVTANQLTTDIVFNKVITYIPCCKNVEWLVHMAADLLVIDLKSKSKICKQCERHQYASTYNLWQKPHPFVSIVTACSESSMLAMKEVQCLLLQCDKSTTNIIQLMKPFILYMLCNPLNESSTVFGIMSMYQLLLNNTTSVSANEKCCTLHDHNITALQLLVESIPLMSPTEHNLYLILQLCQAVLNVSNFSSCSNLLSKLLLNVVSLCFSVVKQPEAATFSLVMLKILKTAPEIKQLPTLGLALAHLLCITPPSTTEVLLLVVFEICTLPAWNSHGTNTSIQCFHALKVSLLQLLSSKNLIGLANCSKQVGKCLKIVNSKIAHLKEQNIAKAHFETTRFDCTLPNHYLINIQTIADVTNSSSLELFETALDIIVYPGMRRVAIILVSAKLMTVINNAVEVDEVLHLLNLLIANSHEASVTVLPCLLNILQTEKNPILVQKLLFVLPKLADQHSIAPIIRTIQVLSLNGKLKPIATYIMLKLWEKQSRCFPFLHKMLSVDIITKDLKSKHEFSTINAVVVKEICRLEPHKHNSDMLKLITNYLEGGSSMIANVALEALYHLCQSEAVNIVSVWNNIKPLVCQIKEPLAVCSVLKLFSLIPNLESPSTEFTQFKDECLKWIWHKVMDENPIIQGSVLVSLAHFLMQDFKLKHLPEKFQPELPMPAEGQSEEECKNQFLEQPVTGDCIVKLALSSKCPNEQTQYFLTSALFQELNNLPRDIKHRALASDKSKPSPAALKAIPAFMLRMYERNKQPNLKLSYASALLMCYSPQCEVDNTGKLVPRSVVARGRNFLQILQALLAEVTVDPKQWQNTMQAVISWKLFMAKCFTAVVESRKMELGLQLKQKKSDDDGDVEYKLATCELSCRDKLTEILKTASKGSPSMQGNAIFALAGLVQAVKAFKLKSNNNSPSQDSTESGFLTNEHWTLMAANTILSISDSNYKPKGRIFSWCQFRAVSGVGQLTTSPLGKSCAIYSLHTLVSVLLPKHSSIVVAMLDILQSHHTALFDVDPQEDLEQTSALALGISFGQVLSEILQNAPGKLDSEDLDKKVRLCCLSMYQTLEKIINSIDNNDCEIDSLGHIGLMLGSGCLYSAMLVSVDSSLQSEAEHALDLLEKILCSSDDSPLSFVHALCMSIAWISVTGLQAKVIETEVALKFLRHIQERWRENQNNTGLSQVVSLLSHCMADEEVDDAKQLSDELFLKWLGQVGKERIPTRQKLAAINGLAGLVGSGTTIVPMSRESGQTLEQLSQVLKILQDLIKNNKDAGVASNAIVVLAGIFLATQIVKKSSGTFPSSFSYLPGSSILKPMFDLLSMFVKQKDQNNKVKIICTSLAEASANSAAYPPVNWSSCLSNLIEQHKECQEACLQICINGYAENPTLASVLSSWSQVTSVEKLNLCSQRLIYTALPAIIKCLSESRLALLLKSYSKKVLVSSLSEFILKGLVAAMHLTGHSAEMERMLQTCVTEVYSVFSICSEDGSISFALWRLLSDCVGKCTNCETLISTAEPVSDESLVVKSLMVKLHLVNSGMKSIPWVFATLVQCSSLKFQEFKKISLCILFHFATQWKTSNNGNLSKLKCLEAVQEYLVMLNNSSPKSFPFMVKVLAVIVVSLSSEKTNTNCPGDPAITEFLWCNCLNTFAPCMSNLLSLQPWKEKLTGPVIDWLLVAMKFEVESSTKLCLVHTLLSLKHTKHYARTMNWTTAVSNLLL